MPNSHYFYFSINDSLKTSVDLTSHAVLIRLPQPPKVVSHSAINAEFTPDGVFGTHGFRKLVAKKFDGSAQRQKAGRPRTDKKVEELVVRMARGNPSWGYDRIAGALSNLGISLSDESIGNILKRHGIDPGPHRKSKLSWAEFIKNHQNVLTACDFFTVEVLTQAGLITYYVLFFIHLGSRNVHIAGITPNPDEAWMKRMATNVTMKDWGFLDGQKYLLMDRDTKFSKAFRKILRDAGTRPIRLPARSPNLNAFAERFVRSIKNECLSHLIFFSEDSLRTALREYIKHYHEERNHQGKENVLLCPNQHASPTPATGKVKCRERLGGLLKFYYRETA